MSKVERGPEPKMPGLPWHLQSMDILCFRASNWDALCAERDALAARVAELEEQLEDQCKFIEENI